MDKVTESPWIIPARECTHLVNNLFCTHPESISIDGRINKCWRDICPIRYSYGERQYSIGYDAGIRKSIRTLKALIGETNA